MVIRPTITLIVTFHKLISFTNENFFDLTTLRLELCKVKVLRRAKVELKIIVPRYSM